MSMVVCARATPLPSAAAALSSVSSSACDSVVCFYSLLTLISGSSSVGLALSGRATAGSLCVSFGSVFSSGSQWFLSQESHILPCALFAIAICTSVVTWSTWSSGHMLS